MRMSFEWFQSLLLAIEEQDIDQFIEIHTYLTARLRHSDIGNILVNDDGNIKDTITGLRAPTHYGRPNWDRIFSNMREQHPSTDVGVFFCGPKPLGKLLNNKCNLWSQGSEEGTNFVYGKGKNTFCLFLQAYGNAFAVILNPSFEVLMFLDKSSKDTINSKKSTIIPITNITIPDQSSYTYARQFISITNIVTVTKFTFKFDDLTDVTKLAQQLLCHALDMKKNDWSKIRMFEFRLNLDEKAQLMNKIDSFQCIKCPELNEHYGLIHEIMSLGKKLDELLHTITGENLELMPEYEQRIEVLKSLKYIDEKTSVVQLRGQIACKIVKKADNESEYDPAEIVALLSSRKNASELTLTPNLEKLRSMLERFKEKKNVDIQVDDYVETIKFGLVQVVYELARGMLMGNIELCAKMDKARSLIKRDIVFATSLMKSIVQEKINRKDIQNELITQLEKTQHHLNQEYGNELIIDDLGNVQHDNCIEHCLNFALVIAMNIILLVVKIVVK
ncbi:7757_t:CDS:10 [Entrophospora sp. SA101]|nr:7757_t:CDS:10 [Entrophospora sp. SA101]